MSSLCLLLIGVINFFGMPYQFSPKGGDTIIRMVIRLSKRSDRPKFFKAALAYNKDFAYSLTLDDGLISAYRVALPLMSGGRVSGVYLDEWKNDQGGDGKRSTGLFYTDGCGHKLPFRASIAINAKSIESDSVKCRGHLSWEEVISIAHAGWSVTNHGYGHQTSAGTDYNDEITKNNESVLARTNIRMRQFVVPGGSGQKNYDILYTDAAFLQGMYGVGGNQGPGPLINVSFPLNLFQLSYQRAYATSNQNIKALYKNELNILDSLDKAAKMSKNGGHYWFNEFTHSAGNQNLWSISLCYPTFKYYLKMLAARFGATGSDRLWVASFEEVYDYLLIRDQINISARQAGCKVYLKIKIPKALTSLRFKTISLTVFHKSKITLLNIDEKVSHSSVSHRSPLLINVRF